MQDNIQARSKNHSSNGLADGADRRNDYVKPDLATQAKNHRYYCSIHGMLANTSISDDDPQVIQKLTERLNVLMHLQIFMKAANQCLYTNDKAAFLQLEFGTDMVWKDLNIKVGGQPAGYSAKQLTSNSAKIQRVWNRITELIKDQPGTMTEKTVKGVRVIQNTILHKMQLVFKDRPSNEVIIRLHREHAFHAYVMDFAWQRLLNPAAICEAEHFLAWYDPEKQPFR